MIRITRRALAWAALPLWGGAIAGIWVPVPASADRVLVAAALIAGATALSETSKDRDKELLIRALADASRRGVRAQTGPMRRVPGHREGSPQERLWRVPDLREEGRAGSRR